MSTLVNSINSLAAAIREKFNAIAPRLMPLGGAVGQVPVRTASGVEWGNQSGGGGSAAPSRINTVVIFADALSFGLSNEFAQQTGNGGSTTNFGAGISDEMLGTRYGVALIRSGATAFTGGGFVTNDNRNGANIRKLMGGEILRAAIYIPSATLADSRFSLGWGVAWNGVDNNEQAVIRVVGGNAVGRTGRAGTVSEVVIATLLGDRWYELELLVNANATAITFNILDGENLAVLNTAQSTTNITTARHSPGFNATSTTAGAKDIVAIDYIYAEIPTGRAR
jgi:hypothetical protein